VHILLQASDSNVDADRHSLSSLSSESSSGSTSSLFKQSRELWRRRVDSESSGSTPTPNLGLPLRQKHTPDLVMDLPLNSSSSNSPSPSPSPSGPPEENQEPPSDANLSPQHTGPESPDMTAAERFAKQNQCTLKKNTRTSSSSSTSSTSAAVDAQTQTQLQSNRDNATDTTQSQPKPPLKAKPQILKKPTAIIPSTSPDLSKDRASTPTNTK
jgi:hypothetical protein